jgi:hypothetical protein
MSHRLAKNTHTTVPVTASAAARPTRGVPVRPRCSATPAAAAAKGPPRRRWPWELGSGGVVELWNWGSRKVESASFKLESRGTFALCLLQVNYFQML